MLIRFFYLKRNLINQRFTLGKDQRLKSRKRIERIFREGKSINVFPYRVYYMLENASGPRTSGGTGAPGATNASGATDASGAPGATNASRAPNGPTHSLQAGLGVSSRHFKKAVDRNRIKRLTREAYRLNKGVLSGVVEQRNLSLSVFFI